MDRMAQPASFAPARARAATARKSALGKLPEWNLNDLYPGLDSRELKRDLDQADAECAAFEEAFKGKLQALATGEGAGKKLAEAVKRYEAIEDKLGRLYSYASLLYAGNSVDPVRAKFHGDVQEHITAASIHLLFLTL